MATSKRVSALKAGSRINATRAREVLLPRSSYGDTTAVASKLAASKSTKRPDTPLAATPVPKNIV